MPRIRGIAARTDVDLSDETAGAARATMAAQSKARKEAKAKQLAAHAKALEKTIAKCQCAGRGRRRLRSDASQSQRLRADSTTLNMHASCVIDRWAPSGSLVRSCLCRSVVRSLSVCLSVRRRPSDSVSLGAACMCGPTQIRRTLPRVSCREATWRGLRVLEICRATRAAAAAAANGGGRPPTAATRVGYVRSRPDL